MEATACVSIIALEVVLYLLCLIEGFPYFAGERGGSGCSSLALGAYGCWLLHRRPQFSL